MPMNSRTIRLFVIAASVTLSVSVVATAQTPLPGAQRITPRQILTTRTDDQLLSLLTAPRTYTIYTFELRGSFDHARVRNWNGVMVMPRPSDLGVVGPVTFAGVKGRKLTDSWYKHPDGTISKILLNSAGQQLAVLSTRGLSVWTQLDIDRDGIVDFFRLTSLDGIEVVAASIGAGAAFLERWRIGEAKLCDIDQATAPALGPKAGERSGLSGTPGTMPACDHRQPDPGLLSRITPSKAPPTPDPMDRLCEGRGGPARPGVGVGPYASAGGTYSGLVSIVVGSGRNPGERRPADAAMMEEVERDRQAAEIRDIAEQMVRALYEKPARKQRRVESPTIGSEGTRGGDAEQALNALCASRERAQRRWSVVHDALNGNNTTAAGTDCDDPVTDPAAADAEKTMPKCGPSRETQSVGQQLAGQLGAYQSRQCGRTERPGPDGTCRGTRNLTGNRAQLWYGWGSIIGLVPCNRETCDPEGP